MSNDGLVEFTTQPALPQSAGPRAASAPYGAFVSATVGGNGLVTATAGGGGAEGGGSSSEDFLDLMEVTAGGRRIATSRGKLPWEPRSASVGSRHSIVSSRCGARTLSISSLPLGTAHEEADAEAEQGKLIDLQERLRAERGVSASGARSAGKVDGSIGGVRIEVPAKDAGIGSLSRQNLIGMGDGGPPLSAGGPSGLLSASTDLEFEPGLGCLTPTSLGSPQREHEKIQLWLPRGQAAQQGFALPQPSRRSADDALALGDEGSGETAPPPSLELVKPRGAPTAWADGRPDES
jgi:hypothetical protein